MESLWHATHALEASPDALEPGAHFDTVVAGAGITGLTTAVLLARSGQRVAVLEARRIGAVTTGGTTGKLSVLQGTVLSQIRRFHSDEVLGAYVEGNQEGSAWLLRFLQEHHVEVQRRPAYSYSTTLEGARKLRQELDAARAAGLDAGWTDQTELPMPLSGALVLQDQAQLHPMPVLEALVADLREHGGVVMEGVRVTGTRSGSPLRVSTSQGEVRADRLVLATGTPILDRGGYFAKLLPLRSYILAFRLPEGSALPHGMYLGIDSSGRSLRSAPTADGEFLLVGGNGHVVGRSESERRAVQDLESWTAHHYPGSKRTHAWSAQDYRTLNRVPFVGKLPRGGGSIWLATGYNKWGLSNAVAASLSLSGQILGGHMPWAETLSRRVTKPAGILEAVGTNASVAATLVGGWARSLLHSPDRPGDGEGTVGRDGARVVAESNVDGATCRVSGVCTHLGGTLRWNDAERSWDCPLHGSRFAPDGTLLEGPAVNDLAKLD